MQNRPIRRIGRVSLSAVSVKVKHRRNPGSKSGHPSQKKARASVLFSIQSEGLVCNQRAPRDACNPSLRDGMASRFSAYSRFSAFGLIPYITS